MSVYSLINLGFFLASNQLNEGKVHEQVSTLRYLGCEFFYTSRVTRHGRQETPKGGPVACQVLEQVRMNVMANGIEALLGSHVLAARSNDFFRIATSSRLEESLLVTW